MPPKKRAKTKATPSSSSSTKGTKRSGGRAGGRSAPKRRRPPQHTPQRDDCDNSNDRGSPAETDAAPDCVQPRAGRGGTRLAPRPAERQPARGTPKRWIDGSRWVAGRSGTFSHEKMASSREHEYDCFMSAVTRAQHNFLRRHPRKASTPLTYTPTQTRSSTEPHTPGGGSTSGHTLVVRTDIRYQKMDVSAKGEIWVPMLLTVVAWAAMYTLSVYPAVLLYSWVPSRVAPSVAHLTSAGRAMLVALTLVNALIRATDGHRVSVMCTTLVLSCATLLGGGHPGATSLAFGHAMAILAALAARLVLTGVTHQMSAGSYPPLSLEAALMRLQTGDILLHSGDSILSRVIKFVCISRHSHCAIVIRRPHYDVLRLFGAKRVHTKKGQVRNNLGLWELTLDAGIVLSCLRTAAFLRVYSNM